MTIHHQIPTAGDFARLTGDFDPAVTIYLATSRHLPASGRGPR